ncbi:DUF6167 family protein [Nocardioides limicola]|uniref:DUF6167 family protein n=1 Tax=Nocardioides limicola TaxID=2803368 RepID=UPI00193B2E48|nr:DUF6167 family protein [Nocardioides sp. DJM-14]
MSRSLWFVAGAGAGIYAAVRARRVAESLTPDGMRDRAKGLALGARLLTEEFVAGSREREAELRRQWGLVTAPEGLPTPLDHHRIPAQPVRALHEKKDS